MRYMRLLRCGAIATPVTLAAMSSVALPSAAQAQTTLTGDRPASTQPPLTAAQARALSTNVTDKVIVVFKNQFARLTDAPDEAAARSAVVASAQSGVLSQLSQTHGLDVKSFSLVNAVAATVSAGEARYLAANPVVREVVPDLPIPIAGDSPLTIAPAGPTAGLKPLPLACAPGRKVQLDPEAIENIHAATQSGTGDAAQALGYTGAGVKVAFIADGVNPDNPDFIRANGKHVFIDYKDFSGTGTDAPTGGGEAFLDSSSIAAQGRHVYNVADFGGELSTACRIRILGVAPGASLVGLNVLGSAESTYASVFLEAINYAVTHDHVNVLNESFGGNPFPDTTTLDLTKMANDAAVKAGVTVTVASGDAGPTDTIGSPATDPHVISAGASTTYRAYAQSGSGGITAPGVKGWLDNNISGLSSGGFAQNGATVDVVAPGDSNWALCTADPAKFSDCTNLAGRAASVELAGGTSEAAPLTAGVAALVIQAYRKAHNGATPSPAVVKQIIVSTAANINAPADQQGAGKIDAYQAVLAAASYHVSKPCGHAILKSATQFNAVGQPGTTEHFAETFTNDGAGAVTVGLSSRTLAAYQPVSTKSLSLARAKDYATTVSFEVPKGQSRLNASVALVGRVNLSLIAPNGDLAEYNGPQGVSNYGNAQTADPAPGKWKALISTPGTGAAVAARFQASTATWQAFGTLSKKSVTLAPGASGSVALTVATPSQAGDEDGSIIARSSATSPAFAAVTSIPVTLRSLAPTPSPSTTFTGTLTGGNGRQSDTGQTAYYQFELPAGLRALNASIDTGNASNPMFAELVNPSGNAVSAAANGLLATTTKGTIEVKPEIGTQLHVLDPSRGLWTLAIDFYNTVSGTAVAQPFTVSINDTPVSVDPWRLPDGGQVPAGKRIESFVEVENTGTTPEAYFLDARLNDQVKLDLAAQTTSTLTLPNVTGVVPEYLVPSHTTALKVTASSSAPLFFDVSYPYGDPDVISSIGKTATASYSASPIGGGDWAITPFLEGPFGKKAAKKVTATTSMTATTAGFDSTVSSPTGDLWLGGTRPATPFTPYVVNPGQVILIPVTITPRGKIGSTVRGTLYLADSSFVSTDLSFDDVAGYSAESSDVAAFPYHYTIGCPDSSLVGC
jgi:subtilisin family serine protease